MVNAAAALVPVVVFLALLVLFDSFKLVPPRALARALMFGALAALAALALNGLVSQMGVVPLLVITRYLAPVLEETAKLLPIAYVVRRRQVGFPVDAAITGFAVGTGFALVENVWYLGSLASPGAIIWLVRGFGAAILHGATAAILAIWSQSLADRRPEAGASVFLPGALAAIAIHSTYNHFVLPPVVAMLVLLMVLPPLVLVVFDRSERALREWVGAGLDLDLELLRLVLSDDFGSTRLGEYLRTLRSRFPGPVVADMFCLMRLELELSVRAKGMLLAREAGMEVPAGADLAARLEELRYLERSIGKTGLLALRPLQVSTHRDQWHRFLLGHHTP
ncbi:MAG TPA: PrsW family glutamic-type intramembrane protease [Vicinamibacterales bacterium]|nr:PrsW family glutamic-type intramembrane protease [Vicinamibacterales bacterium]